MKHTKNTKSNKNKMIDINVTRVSSKGQIVIPLDMRDSFKEGDKIVVMKGEEDTLILKKMNKFYEKLLDDLEFARRTEKAYEAYERGEFISMDFDEFIKEMKKW